MPDPHSQAIARSFSQQAPWFEDPRVNSVLTDESRWLFAGLERGPDDVVLDVAAGTGQAGRSLAGEVRAVIALDATEAMLRVGRERALEDGLTNVVFMRGDAAALPFLAGSFSIVICRYALHHFVEPAVQLLEMVRCLGVGGRLAVADLVVSEDARVAARTNELERLRDPSHVRARAPSELADAVVGLGLELVSVETRPVRRPLASWLETTATPASGVSAIRGALDDELAGGAETGFQPEVGEDGEMTFVQTYTSVIALKREG